VYWQTPATQLAPSDVTVSHTLPQAPQLLTSVEVFLHEPAQSVSLLAQLLTQEPPEQTSPLPQALAHFPQLSWSLASVTQAPLQSVCPAPQPHWPPVQTSPAAHA
jgi:hypothetical protein